MSCLIICLFFSKGSVGFLLPFLSDHVSMNDLYLIAVLLDEDEESKHRHWRHGVHRML